VIVGEVLNDKEIEALSMAEREVERASTTGGLPVSMSLAPSLEVSEVPAQPSLIDGRTVLLCGLSIFVGVGAAFIARALIHLIALITNISFLGIFSFSAEASPAQNHLGWWVVAIPVIGGIVVGFMARYGSKAIRGHGIPEAMEVVLLNQSRIPARLTFLKPISAAIAIGTGGPFGAEGPIIATGGALGSLVGQIIPTTATERKILLSAGAAAGMAATFGSPVAAVLLAVELLLFEFRARSIIPVALAAATAAGMRLAFHEKYPIFAMPMLTAPGGVALTTYIVIGAIMGLVATVVTRAVYWIEDMFEELPVHWMWWPAIGAVAVGVVGYFSPHTMGVGYDNITHFLNDKPLWSTALIFVLLKFISWAIALGSGTSGGTLAPLFTIGGGVGLALGMGASHLLPGAGIDYRIAALVGMAALFAGSSRALLTSVVFAFETTLQPLGLLPLLGGCSAAFVVSALTMRHSIMTEKIARRGIKVPADYTADFLDTVVVHEVMSRNVRSLRADDTLDSVRKWINTRVPGTTHQGYPVLDDSGLLIGVLTRRNLLDPDAVGAEPIKNLINRPPSYIYDDLTLRDAADHMVRHNVGRLPVVSRAQRKLTGIVTRSDILSVHRRRLKDTYEAKRIIRFRSPWGREPAGEPPASTQVQERDQVPESTTTSS
jgi:H+/Cl- antiporter ClcA/predicted transcriptional regulator